MNDPKDNMLETWLEGGSEISRTYAELDDAQPPPELDRHILDAGRAAVTSGNVVRLQRWRNWSLPVALAASAVIAVPLVVHVFEAPPAPTATTAGRVETASPTADTRRQQQPAGVSNGRTSDSITAPEPATNTGAAPAPSAPVPTDTDVTESLRALADSSGANLGYTSLPRQPARAEQTPPPRHETDQEARESDLPGVAARDIPQAAETQSGFAAAPPRDTARADAAVAYSDSEDAAAQDPEAMMAVKTAPAAPAEQLDRSRPNARLAANALRVETGPEAGQWLDEIAALHAAGAMMPARRQLGELLSQYPDYKLPADFPLQRRDALFDSDRQIVQDAETWLAGIAALARAQRIDAARQQLARFFARYPGYELPDDFPLDRTDAAPIER